MDETVLIGGPVVPTVGSNVLEMFNKLEAEGDPDAVLNSVNKFYYDLLFGRTRHFCYKNGMYEIIPGHFYSEDDRVIYGPVRPAKVYIIGEKPSYAEEQASRNLVGDYGLALWETLRELKYNLWNETYIANVCRVPVRQRSLITRLTKELGPLIWTELALLQPDVILCLGATALKQFSRTAIKKLLHYGPEVIEYAYAADDAGVKKKKAKLMAAPLTALHEYSDYLNFRHALHIFIRYGCEGQIRPQQKVPFKVITEVETLKEIVDTIVNQPELEHVAVDLEWHGHNPWSEGAFVRLIGFAHKDMSYVIPIKDNAGNPVQQNPDEIIKVFSQLFKLGNNVQIIGHNFISDAIWLEFLGVKILAKFYESLENLPDPEYSGVFDTMVAHHAHDESGTLDLESLAIQALDVEPWKNEIDTFLAEYNKQHKVSKKHDVGFGPVIDSILFPYSAKDCLYTLKLAEYEKKRVMFDRFGHNCLLPYKNLMKALPAYSEMMKRGIILDVELYNRLLNIYKTAYDESVQQFREKINWPTFNHRSHPQKVELLFDAQYIPWEPKRPETAVCFGLTPIKSTAGVAWEEAEAGSSPAVDAETCEALQLQDTRVKDLLYIAKLDHVLKNVLVPDKDGMPAGLRAYVCADGRIHPSYFPFLETRRASSKQPNMQNLANNVENIYREILGDKYLCPIRSVFKADEGRTFVEVDYSGAELLALGVSSGDETLIQDYYRSTKPGDDADKLDIHSSIAVLAFNLNCPPTKEGLKSVNAEHLRLSAKRVIFGLNYGRGAESCYRQLTSSGIDITLEGVERIIETIYNKYKRVRSYQNAIRQRVRNVRWLRNNFGSFRRFWQTRSSEIVAKMEREGLNFPCQSNVADAINKALYNLFSHPKKKELEYFLVAQNHDAVVISVPTQNVQRFLREVVLDAFVLNVPLYKCDIDGNQIDDKPYYFSIDVKFGACFGDLT